MNFCRLFHHPVVVDNETSILAPRGITDYQRAARDNPCPFGRNPPKFLDEIRHFAGLRRLALLTAAGKRDGANLRSIEA
jgi:hypothetical protein